MSGREQERVTEDGHGRATDLRTGATLWRADRDQLAYELDGRRLELYVEADRRGTTVWFAQQPTWTDGTALTADEVAAAQDTVRAVAAFCHESLELR